ncbi:TetR/AcrR family transcriptional regulator [Maritalea sp.]|uniref:TetR/AcrR family transcriptional regulator n=1 Tax=Maritalea sp. TaxID=2003361 RepID=UPI003EF41DE3
MRDEKKLQKQQAIEIAAYALIEEKGYLGTSMLAIAKRARASNETLYNWYGDKQGLFRVLIEQNAKKVSQLLDEALQKDRSPHDTLSQLGPLLLELLLGSRAIALNRAAAADQSGELGKTLSQSGKETIFPLIVENFSKFSSLDQKQVLEAAQTYLALLVGDQQIRRAIGAVEMPTKGEITARANWALSSSLKLYDLG